MVGGSKLSAIYYQFCERCGEKTTDRQAEFMESCALNDVWYRLHCEKCGCLFADLRNCAYKSLGLDCKKDNCKVCKSKDKP